MSEAFIGSIGLVVLFLAAISILQEICKRLNFPYVVALLVLGFIAQFFARVIGVDQLPTVTPDFIFFVLLPLLLFGAALHINLHQFKLQMKTILFLATVGLMLSILVVGGGVSMVLGWPLLVGLLFGAMVSATDPIAVLAIFKTLGAPKRLALLADGESMFNDATAVIAFRILLAAVVSTAGLTIPGLAISVATFVVTLVGSIAFGALMGLLTAMVIEGVDRDMFVETTLTLITALGTFLLAEHLLHISGVISTVVAGLVVGNLGITKISGNVTEFLTDFWDYVSLSTIAIVFFFAAFNLDFSVLSQLNWQVMVVILIVLFARAVSVYASMFVSNRVRWFKDEPDVQLSWQHVLNWGGLRGVIPLVLAFSLPDNFVYKSELLALTLAVLLFSLFVNGLSIKWLLLKLGVTKPQKRGQLQQEAQTLLKLEEIKHQLSYLPDIEYENKKMRSLKKQLREMVQEHKTTFLELATVRELEKSLQLQALELEKKVAGKLFRRGFVTENPYFDVITQLDLQTDAIEHPEIFVKRVIKKGGEVDTSQTWRAKLRRMRACAAQMPIFFTGSSDQLLMERYLFLKTRLAGNQAVQEYLDQFLSLFSQQRVKKVIKKLQHKYRRLADNNQSELAEIIKQSPDLVEEYHAKVLAKLVPYYDSTIESSLT